MTIVNHVGKNRIHEGLESGRSIAEAKGHNQWFKEAKRAFEGCFPFIAFTDANIVIAPSYIKFGKEASTLELVDEFRDKW